MCLSFIYLIAFFIVFIKISTFEKINKLYIFSKHFYRRIVYHNSFSRKPKCCVYLFLKILFCSQWFSSITLPIVLIKHLLCFETWKL